MLGSQSTKCGCCRTPAVVERHRLELGTGQGLERRVGNRWEGAGLSGLPAGSQGQGHYRQSLDRRWEQQQPGHALHRPFAGFPPPSCGPSTPCGFP
jgi:hypothetical protein